MVVQTGLNIYINFSFYQKVVPVELINQSHQDDLMVEI